MFYHRFFISAAVLFSILFIIPFEVIPAPSSNLVQVAILLDTSNSMDGLIEQAKTQLWKIVNEMARAKLNGRIINLQVALYEYGKDSIPAKEGYLRMVSSLTNDLDGISEELFKLKTNGGSEYCGKVIDAAVRDLTWSKNNNYLKEIFIAGNEPFDQGDVDFHSSCKKAIQKGIIVNTIFCGNYNEGVRTNWKKGAELADGKYININQNQRISHINAPQDAELIKLGHELNETYIAYGKKGLEKKRRQKMQDKNASHYSPAVSAQRSITKASAQYKNESWDLVDAKEEGTVDISKLKDSELPAPMKGMSKKEREKYLFKQAQKRKNLQEKINSLNEARRKYIEKQRVKNADKNTLDAAIISIIHEQSKAKGYTFD